MKWPHPRSQRPEKPGSNRHASSSQSHQNLAGVEALDSVHAPGEVEGVDHEASPCPPQRWTHYLAKVWIVILIRWAGCDTQRSAKDAPSVSKLCGIPSYSCRIGCSHRGVWQGWSNHGHDFGAPPRPPWICGDNHTTYNHRLPAADLLTSHENCRAAQEEGHEGEGSLVSLDEIGWVAVLGSSAWWHVRPLCVPNASSSAGGVEPPQATPVDVSQEGSDV